MSNLCPQCGAPVPADAKKCEYCGAEIPHEEPVAQPQPQPQQVVYVQQPVYNNANTSLPIKSKVAAGLLAILLGGIGVHKFYLGKTGMGILYLLFCWTGIPAVIGLIEGIVILCSSDENFGIKYQCRVQ